MKAVIPVAGFGTRFIPTTKAQPKEMLPIYNKPTPQYHVEEAIASGIADLLIVTGRTKDSSKTISTNHMNENMLCREQGKTVTLKK